MCIRQRPCKVLNIATSKTGKHGSCKNNFTAVDIFTGRKYEDLYPSAQAVDVPNVGRNDFSLLNITDDGFLNLFGDGETKDDLRLPEYPEGLADQIRNDFGAGKSVVLTVMKAMGEEHVVCCREETA